MAKVCMRRRLDLKRSVKEMAAMVVIVTARTASRIDGAYQQEQRRVTYIGTLNHVPLALCHLMSYSSNF